MGRPVRKGMRRISGMVFISLVVIVLSFLAFRRNIVWKDDLALWSYAVVKSPAKPRTHTSKGLAYDRDGFLHEAMKEYFISIRLDPDYLYPYPPLAVIYGKIGELDTSIEIFSWYLKLAPDDYMTHTGLGVSYALKERFEDAEREFRLALKLNPNYELAAENLKRFKEKERQIH